MASIDTVLGSLATSITTAIAGVGITSQVGVGWPSQNALKDGVQNKVVIVSIYDRKIATNTTRWTPSIVGQTITPASVEATKNAGSITIVGTSAVGDWIGYSDSLNRKITIGLSAGLSAAQVASALSSAINAQGGPVVTVAGDVVHIGALLFNCATCNAATQITEVGRRNRQLQVTVWAYSFDARSAVSDAIEGALATMEAGLAPYAAGLSLSDGTSARVMVGSSYDVDDAILGDCPRRDMLASVDYSVTTQDAAYAVLMLGNDISVL